MFAIFTIFASFVMAFARSSSTAQAIAPRTHPGV